MLNIIYIENNLKHTRHDNKIDLTTYNSPLTSIYKMSNEKTAHMAWRLHLSMKQIIYWVYLDSNLSYRPFSRFPVYIDINCLSTFGFHKLLLNGFFVRFVSFIVFEISRFNTLGRFLNYRVFTCLFEFLCFLAIRNKNK